MIWLQIFGAICLLGLAGIAGVVSVQLWLATEWCRDASMKFTSYVALAAMAACVTLAYIASPLQLRVAS